MSPLTFERRRAFVAAFWIVGGALFFVAVAATAFAAGSASPFGWAAAGVLAIVLPGLLWRPWFDAGVWAWNGSVRRFAAVLRGYVLRVTYGLVVVPAGAAGGTPASRHMPRGASSWVERGAGTAGAVPDHSESAASWVRSAYLFVGAPGALWSVSLLPCMFLLALLRDDDEGALPLATTYTLF